MSDGTKKKGRPPVKGAPMSAAERNKRRMERLTKVEEVATSVAYKLGATSKRMDRKAQEIQSLGPLASEVKEAWKSLADAVQSSEYDKYSFGLMKFVSSLDVGELRQIAKSNSNIIYSLDDDEWMTWPAGHDNPDGFLIVFNSEGMADATISTSALRLQIIEDAEALTEEVRFHE